MKYWLCLWVWKYEWGWYFIYFSTFSFNVKSYTLFNHYLQFPTDGSYLDTVEVGLLHGVTVEEQKSGLVWTYQIQWQPRRQAAATADFYPHTLATQYPAKDNFTQGKM